jgi:hypothetical protein
MFEQFGTLVNIHALYELINIKKPENQTWILLYSSNPTEFDEVIKRENHFFLCRNGRQIASFGMFNSVLVFEESPDPYQQCLDDLQTFLDEQPDYVYRQITYGNMAQIEASVVNSFIDRIRQEFIDKRRKK